jgi:Flp pilus assembly pilin Flp
MIRARKRTLPARAGKGLVRDQKGGSEFIQYLVLVAIAVTCIAAFTKMGKAVKDRFGEQTESVTTVTGPGG